MVTKEVPIVKQVLIRYLLYIDDQLLQYLRYLLANIIAKILNLKEYVGVVGQNLIENVVFNQFVAI